MTGRRADYQTLVSLGLSEDDMRAMGLWDPAEGDPETLMDLYLRRSTKREDVATLRGHLRDAVRYASQTDRTIRHVWFEQLSASKTYVRRREFEKATQAVLDGMSKTLGVWKTDRFDRRGMGAVGRLLDEFDTRRAGLVSITEGLDSRQRGARMLFALLSERAREEAKDIALRVKAGHDAHKEENRRGTGKPPFGTLSPRTADGKPSGKVEPNPDEFETARRLLDLLLGTAEGLPDEWADKEGQPLTTKDVAHILNVEKRTTRGGHTWSPTAVSKLAQSPLFYGMVPVRERKTDEHGNPLGEWKGYGEPATDEKGNVRMCGTGVGKPAEFWRVRELIRSRTNEDFGKGQPGAKYLGTGVYRCGRLRDKGKGKEEHCLASMSHRGGRYRCQDRQTRGAVVCEGCTTLCERIDAAVGNAWLAHVAALEPGDPVLLEIGRRWLAFSNPEDQAARENTLKSLDSAKARLKKLEDDYYVFGRVSDERYEELSEKLSTTIQNMTQQLEELDHGQDYSVFSDGETLRETWMETDVPTRRMLLRCALGKKGVIVLPAKRQGDPTPIEDRLIFDWLSGVPA
ncbi:integrase [Streptomyces phage Rowa]|uniref:Integrase n=1 Tax=Streptomyces phage Rowa TaxID=2059883 RepID=A0A2H5BLZ7_9CAUD|nr:integrase [Streptomyces phage Rowa]AUG87323.1 integrase [Streptomyces phage Rowa]